MLHQIDTIKSIISSTHQLVLDDRVLPTYIISTLESKFTTPNLKLTSIKDVSLSSTNELSFSASFEELLGQKNVPSQLMLFDHTDSAGGKSTRQCLVYVLLPSNKLMNPYASEINKYKIDDLVSGTITFDKTQPLLYSSYSYISGFPDKYPAGWTIDLVSPAEMLSGFHQKTIGYLGRNNPNFFSFLVDDKNPLTLTGVLNKMGVDSPLQLIGLPKPITTALSKIESINVSALAVSIDAVTKPISGVSVQLSSADDFPIINGVISLEKPSLELDIPLHFKSIGVQALLKGNWNIGGAHVSTSIAFPSLEINAQLLPTPALKSSAVLKWFSSELKVDMPSQIPTITLANLEVYGNLRDESVGLYATAVTDAKIKGLFSIPTLSFSTLIEKQKGAGWTGEFFLNGIFEIGSITLLVEAVYSKEGKDSNFYFEGRTPTNAEINLGDVVDSIQNKFGGSKKQPDNWSLLHHFSVEEVYVSFDSDGTFDFKIGVDYEFSETKTVRVEFGIHKDGSSASLEFKVTATFDNNEFTLDFLTLEQKDGATGKQKDFILLASYQNTSHSLTFLAHFIGLVAPDEIAADIPDDLYFELKSAFIGYYKPQKPKTSPPAETDAQKPFVVFGLDVELEGKFDFSDIPAIGSMLHKVTIDIQDLRVVGTSAKVQEQAKGVINSQLASLALKPLDDGQKNPQKTLEKEVFLSAQVKLPEPIGQFHMAHTFVAKKKKPKTAPLAKKANLTVETPDALAATPAPSEPSVSPTNNNKSLQPVGQKIGPIFIQNLGIEYVHGRLGVKVTGGIELGPMVMELIGLSITTPLNKFEPHLDINGLAAGYDKPPLTIAGALMKFDEKTPKDPTPTSLLQEEKKGIRGGLSIGMEEVSVTVLAQYATVKDYNTKGDVTNSYSSLFLFGFLGAPLGGPPFLYVSGLALGMGYNLGLNIPKPEQFNTFPLTAAALRPPGTALTVQGLTQEMQKMDQYMPITEGEFWLAAGIKFDSFDFLSGFLMLSVKFGHELEIDVLGILSADLPPSDPNPVIRMDVGFSIRFLPEQGIIQSQGAFLPTTFIFNKDVKITGGMAFLAVTKKQTSGTWNGADAGVFVFTLGGYGPYYKPKEYYPKVENLALTWHVSDNLFITARAYFVLTPEAIMLGGQLHGHYQWHGGPVRVSVDFLVGADFIVYWKPLMYLAHAYASIHIKGDLHVDFLFFSKDYSLEMDASADLKIWGPEFSGRAKVHMHFVISFTVSVSFGNASEKIHPIDWQKFSEDLLPKANKVVSINVSKGMVAETNKHVFPTINPHNGELILDSQVPIVPDNKTTKAVGIKPMGLKAKDFDTSIAWFDKDGKSFDIDKHFIIEPISKNVPTALWESAQTSGEIPPNTGKELIDGVDCGYRLKMKSPSFAGEEKLPLSDTAFTLDGPVGALDTNSSFSPSSTVTTDTVADLFYPKTPSAS